VSDEASCADEVSHPDAVRIAAYADGTLAGQERAALEAHLADCAECRAEATDVALLLRDHDTAGRWRIAIPAAAAVAAAALVLIAGPLTDRGPDGVDRLRPGSTAGREAVPRIEVVLPGAAVPIAADSPRFVWRAAGADARYHFTLTEESGQVVWEGQLGDTVLVLPPHEASLEADMRYLWYVDASLPDGRVATSGVRELRTR